MVGSGLFGNYGIVTVLGMWPFVLIALILFRQKAWHPLVVSTIIYLYTWVLLFIEETTFGVDIFGAGFLLMWSGIPLLAFALLSALIPYRTIYIDNATKISIYIGMFCGLVLALLIGRAFILLFVPLGALIGFVITKFLRKKIIQTPDV